MQKVGMIGLQETKVNERNVGIIANKIFLTQQR